MYKIMAGFMGE